MNELYRSRGSEIIRKNKVFRANMTIYCGIPGMTTRERLAKVFNKDLRLEFA